MLFAEKQRPRGWYPNLVILICRFAFQRCCFADLFVILGPPLQPSLTVLKTPPLLQPELLVSAHKDPSGTQTAPHSPSHHRETQEDGISQLLLLPSPASTQTPTELQELLLEVAVDGLLVEVPQETVAAAEMVLGSTESMFLDHQTLVSSASCTVFQTTQPSNKPESTSTTTMIFQSRQLDATFQSQSTLSQSHHLMII